MPSYFYDKVIYNESKQTLWNDKFAKLFDICVLRIEIPNGHSLVNFSVQFVGDLRFRDVHVMSQ